MDIMKKYFLCAVMRTTLSMLMKNTNMSWYSTGLFLNRPMQPSKSNITKQFSYVKADFLTEVVLLFKVEHIAFLSPVVSDILRVPVPYPGATFADDIHFSQYAKKFLLSDWDSQFLELNKLSFLHR